MKPVLICAIFAAVVAAVVCDYDFIDIPAWREEIDHPVTKRGKTHTLDLFDEPADGCEPHEMDDDQRDAIVDLHNDLRRKVAKGEEEEGDPAGPQPSAEDMNKLEYDEDLEKVALAWISQCKKGHDGLRDIDPFDFVGQNVYMEASTEPLPDIDWSNPINSWYDEVKDFNPDDVTGYMGTNSKTGAMNGHYAQIINADTTKIGCAQATYEDDQDGTIWYTRRVVCNYAIGFYVGEDLYTPGDPCEGETDTCDDGLVIP